VGETNAVHVAECVAELQVVESSLLLGERLLDGLQHVEHISSVGQFHEDEHAVADREDVQDANQVRVVELLHRVQLPGQKLEPVIVGSLLQVDDLDRRSTTVAGSSTDTGEAAAVEGIADGVAFLGQQLDIVRGQLDFLHFLHGQMECEFWLRRVAKR